VVEGVRNRGSSGLESPVADILAQYFRVYEHGVYLINFWRWWDETKEHRIKGMNKEKALVGNTKNFVFLDTTAAPKKNYYCRVRAVNVKNIAGKSSVEIRVQT
jgi:hypothetical protein